MRILFENKKSKIGRKTLIWNMILKGPIFAVLISLFKSLLSWTKPELNEIVIFILMFNIVMIVETFIHNYRNHLESIVLNFEGNELIIKQNKPSKRVTNTVVKLNEMEISEIRHMPFSAFSFFNYFVIKNRESKIKISTAGHGDKDIELDEIHKELSNLQKSG